MFDYILTGPISGVSAGQYIWADERDDEVANHSHWLPPALLDIHDNAFQFTWTIPPRCSRRQ